MGRRISIQYPDNTIHSVDLNRLCINFDRQVYFIEYFDSVTNRDMYTVLTLIDGTLMKNPNNEIPYPLLINNCEDLDINFVPDYIPCATLYKKPQAQATPPQIQTQTQRQFIVYKDQYNNLYIGEYVANLYNIPNRGGTIHVDGIKYIKVFQNDIDDIVEKSKNTDIPLYKDYYYKRQGENQKPPKPPKTQTQRQFIVYKDQYNNLYIGEYIANVYNIPNRGETIHIDGIKYIKVFQNDIDSIVEKSKNTDIPLYKDYYNTTKLSNNTENNNDNNEKPLFQTISIITYYHDIKNNKYYLTKEGQKVATQFNILTFATYFENELCYQIDKSKLDKLIETTKHLYTWMEVKKIPKKTTQKIQISKYNNELFIPLDIYTKYKERENRRLIKVDGKLFISISEDDLIEIKRLYSKDNIDLVLENKEIEPKNKELNTMLKKESNPINNNPTQK